MHTRKPTNLIDLNDLILFEMYWIESTVIVHNYVDLSASYKNDQTVEKK